MTAPATIGLFEGYGGLTMAVEEVFGAELIAYSEIDPAASKLLAHHHPDVPNLGDITAIDWDAVRVEDGRPLVLTGGFPCQDLSLAGLGAGLRPGTRSGLWSHMAYAIDQLRPDLVVIENVRGLLSADAACDLEPCPWCVGDDEGRPLRALGAVLGDLADIGYDASWVGLRAADVGAPHGRFRVFVAAWPHVGYADSGDRDRWSSAGLEGEAGPAARPVADTARNGRDEGRPEHARLVGGPDAAVCRDGSAADTDGVGSVRGGRARRGRAGSTHDDLSAADADGAGHEGGRGPGRTGSATLGDGAPLVADTGGDGREGRPERDIGSEGGQPAPLGGDSAGRVLGWGDYEPAIRRWELILGRPAPAPTQTGKRGGQQLSPPFVEWLMGLPAGYVTDPAIGLSRNEQLARLGNGVVSQQAAAALRHLLGVADSGRAAA